ncbi:MAG TPA: 30S ribosomal protein S6 [Candidatus Binataceae bacterium]|nr:30S ribosomal protein S6 [Candidatus Binataceae bacterium]
MRRYETIFIMRPDLGDSAQKETIKRFEGLIASGGGELIETEEWGSRELAYRIKGEQRGFYVRLDYGGTGATMNEIERNLKLSDSILRFLSVLVQEQIDPEAARTELEANRRRVAEARAAAEAARAAAAAERAQREADAATAAAAAAEASASAEAAAPADAGSDNSN